LIDYDDIDGLKIPCFFRRSLSCHFESANLNLEETYSVKYAKFDDATDMIATRPGAFMGKIDIRHAFRICPVHPDDWPLLVYWWDGRYYVDIVLPFGGRSSPFIFNTLADALLWIAQKV